MPVFTKLAFFENLWLIVLGLVSTVWHILTSGPPSGGWHNLKAAKGRRESGIVFRPDWHITLVRPSNAEYRENAGMGPAFLYSVCRCPGEAYLIGFPSPTELLCHCLLHLMTLICHLTYFSCILSKLAKSMGVTTSRRACWISGWALASPWVPSSSATMISWRGKGSLLFIHPRLIRSDAYLQVIFRPDVHFLVVVDDSFQYVVVRQGSPDVNSAAGEGKEQ